MYTNNKLYFNSCGPHVFLDVFYCVARVLHKRSYNSDDCNELLGEGRGCRRWKEYEP